MGDIVPAPIAPISLPPLASLQVRNVDQISVVCDAVNDTLTIISRNVMEFAPSPVPMMPMSGIVVLVVLLMSTFMVLVQYRSRAEIR